MKRTKILDLLNADGPISSVQVSGWVKTKRDSKNLSFLEVNDGSCLKNIQVIAEETLDNFEEVQKIITGSSVSVSGELVASPGKGQSWEIHAHSIADVLQTPIYNHLISAGFQMEHVVQATGFFYRKID